MYGIYANIRGILMVNVTIYGIHGSYGYNIFILTSSPMSSVRTLWQVCRHLQSDINSDVYPGMLNHHGNPSNVFWHISWNIFHTVTESDICSCKIHAAEILASTLTCALANSMQYDDIGLRFQEHDVRFAGGAQQGSRKRCKFQVRLGAQNPQAWYMVHFQWSTQKHQAQYKVGVRWGTLGPVGHKESASLGWEEVPQEQLKSTEFYFKHGSLNVPIEHHPTIRYMVYNGYYKVMSNIPKMGHLPTPVKSNLIQPTEDNLCLHCPSRAACLMLKWLYGLFWHVLVIFINPMLCSKTFKAQSSSILQ